MEGILLTGLKTASTTAAAKGVEKSTEKWGLKGFGAWLVAILVIVLAWLLWKKWTPISDKLNSWRQPDNTKDDNASDETQY